MRLKGVLEGIPIVGPAAKEVWRRTMWPIRLRFTEFYSADYWHARYTRGGNSGSGSYGGVASFKAQILNEFVLKHNIVSVIEFGCGDGNQLSLARYPKYLGFDVSPKAIEWCQNLFAHDASKRFRVYDRRCANTERGELTLSLDVIYHLVEDDIFERHMDDLFGTATRFVIIYSDNEEAPRDTLHIRHRRFSDWIEKHEPEWQLIEHIPSKYPWKSERELGSWADFWIYARSQNCDGKLKTDVV